MAHNAQTKSPMYILQEAVSTCWDFWFYNNAVTLNNLFYYLRSVHPESAAVVPSHLSAERPIRAVPAIFLQEIAHSFYNEKSCRREVNAASPAISGRVRLQQEKQAAKVGRSLATALIFIMAPHSSGLSNDLSLPSGRKRR